MAQSDEYNFFDDLQSGCDPAEALRQNQDGEAQANRLDYLIHKVFEQSAEGKELIDTWEKALIMTPTVVSGEDSKADGIREGKMSFIRGIIQTVNRVEKGE